MRLSGSHSDFEFAEGLHEFGAEHFRQQCGASVAVAVFAGERAAVGDDDVGGFVDEGAEFADAGLGSRGRN